jgi:tetratricopeptide (TPR) repeat protein
MRLTSNEGGVPQSYPLREGSSIIGRHPSCHICVPGRNVSKRHLQVYVENGVVTIRDLGSANGTMVNGNPVTSCVLEHGNEISLGGYRLVLDMNDAEGAPPQADGHAATFDYEPGNQRAEARPVEPPAPDDSPINFQEEPGEDVTPADGQFVPQAYAPQSPQSLQPEVVARDGHMFLRDPRTNREIEVVPRGARASTDLSGYYAERDASAGKRNQYLIWAAIGVAVLMIIALAFTSTNTEIDPLPVDQFPRARYNSLVDDSIQQMTSGNFDKAVTDLKTAQKGRPTWQVADALLQVAEAWQESGKDFDEFNWLLVETPLRQLEDNPRSTSKVLGFATDRRKRIFDLQRQEADAANAVKLLNAGEPEQALAEFAKLPKDSLVRKKYAPQIARSVTAAFTKHLKAGQSALQAQQWDRAIAGFRKAEPYATTAQKADIDRGIRSAEKFKREEAVLRSAHMRMREHTLPSLQAADRLLDGIEDSGPIGQKKVELRQMIAQKREEIKAEGVRSKALMQYETGRGPEAIDTITKNQLTGLYGLRSRIENVMRLVKEAQDAETAKDWELAQAKWLAVQAEEDSPKNAYNRQSVNALASLKRRARDIAEDYNSRAEAALRAEKPKEARKLYLLAMKWDPRATIGKDGLANLLHVAKITYSRARDLRHEGNTEQAIHLFKKVLEYVPEGNQYHQWARRQLSELEMTP